MRAAENGAGAGSGLRGGSFAVEAAARVIACTLRDVRWTEDVGVSGQHRLAGPQRQRARPSVQLPQGRTESSSSTWAEGVSGARATARGRLGDHADRGRGAGTLERGSAPGAPAALPAQRLLRSRRGSDPPAATPPRSPRQTRCRSGRRRSRRGARRDRRRSECRSAPPRLPPVLSSPEAAIASARPTCMMAAQYGPSFSSTAGIAQRERDDGEIGIHRIHRQELQHAGGRQRQQRDDPQSARARLALAEHRGERVRRLRQPIGGRERRYGRQPAALEHA